MDDEINPNYYTTCALCTVFDHYYLLVVCYTYTQATDTTVQYNIIIYI